MKTWTSWITPGFPVIGAARRVEVNSESAEHAALLIRRDFPGASYTLPRPAVTKGYVQDFLDSERARLLERMPA